MKLKELLRGIEVTSLSGDTEIEIANVATDSDKVNKGDVFICLDGRKSDGHKYADIAVARGAAAVVCQKPYVNPLVCVANVSDTRKAYALMSANYFGNPAASLKIVAVVGTNGKSTTAYLLASILNGLGIKCGLIGTMYYEYAGIRLPSELTTPDPLELQSLLRRMVSAGVTHVVSEVSAHAIYLEKLYGIRSDIAIFTNLSQDHLDFFGDMESYKKVKKSYFTSQNTAFAIVNADDACGREILDEGRVPAISYGLKTPADAFAIDITYGGDGYGFTVNIADEIALMETRLFGEFNIYNALAACTAAVKLGADAEKVAAVIKTVEPPAGRFNVLRKGGVTYIVDFAHTPDGIFNLLKEASKLCQGKLITVFGCGGDRDVKKRPIMGRIVSGMSDLVIVTSDNPRTESRSAIAADILAGIKDSGGLYVELDRPKAIALAHELSCRGDVVVLAGKGCEPYIDENNIKAPYSDMGELLGIVGRNCG